MTMADLWECAYCGLTDAPRTREHLFPTALHRRLQECNKVGHVFWLRRLDKDVKGEPTLKDVCSRCNNGYLSDLDAYICREFDSQFSTIRQRFEKVLFSYDFHLLKRWLLKMAYNSARIHSAPDTFALKAVLPYIRGENDHLGRSVRLFLQLAYPAPIPPAERARLGGEEVPEIWEPRLNRVGITEVTVEGIGRKIIRHVALQSYTFMLAYSNPADGASANKEFAAEFLKRAPAAVEVKASQSEVATVCDGINSWDQFRQSR
ncbi:HNH endonuclease [Mesorhizobium sp. B2-3-4]|uniref:HNH endonuclease n=1 Tax=Mesorhizobium sp. B2-3-4 TaxID=2589959 RepID=UPI00112B9266|nr:HNH endonuclease [Mesorhizobium sp. B2-3-4]TPM41392.1 HNH endonuclease [Mesorhizobium sp. B2-3-4]